MIDVVRISDAEFEVSVEEGGTRTKHVVGVHPRDLERYAPSADPQELVRASFEFLLAREPKESILPRFDLSAIERYFPEYPTQIRQALRAAGR